MAPENCLDPNSIYTHIYLHRFFLPFTPNNMALSSHLLLSIHRHSPSLSLCPPPLSSSRTRSALPRLLFCGNASAAAAAATDDPCNVASHPWPEWGHFLERLKSKGYFDDNSADEAPAAALSDINRIKTACLAFARERFDLLRSLSKKDIQAVVESGCPNLFRKTVNSAKRLRAYLQLDEGDVCSACNLRGSCDRAYVMVKEDEGARTVDAVRILLSHATDPLVYSIVEKPLARENIETSARKLISELTELSDTALDPSLPKPSLKVPRRSEQSPKISNHDKTENVEMKKGDWICPKCNFMNFARNLRCLKCKEDGPIRMSENVEMKKGDWICPECQFLNFARNTKCFRCQGTRPKRHLNQGEWECPSCDFLNYRRNMACLKCNCERPEEGVH